MRKAVTRRSQADDLPGAHGGQKTGHSRPFNAGGEGRGAQILGLQPGLTNHALHAKGGDGRK